MPWRSSSCWFGCSAPVAAASRIERFVQGLAFAWATGAPDAHAKNYSLLLSGTQIELAPLYDSEQRSALPGERQGACPSGSAERGNGRNGHEHQRPQTLRRDRETRLGSLGRSCWAR